MMSLLERQPLLIVPGIVLALFMVHAMVQFSMALLGERRRTLPSAAPFVDLRGKILALNGTGLPVEIREDGQGVFTTRWMVVGAEWGSQFNRVKLDSSYCLRILADARRNELRIYEHIRTGGPFIAFEDIGLRPRISLPLAFHAGPMGRIWAGVAYGIMAGLPPRIADSTSFEIDIGGVKDRIEQLAAHAGWTCRQVFWLVETTRLGHSLSQALVPAALRNWSSRRFWGMLYPLTFLLTVAYLMIIIGDWTVRNLLIVGLISIVWWSVWVVLAWALRRLGPSSQIGKR